MASPKGRGNSGAPRHAVVLSIRHGNLKFAAVPSQFRANREFLARNRRTEMSRSSLTATALLTAFMLVGTLAPVTAEQQPAPPKPYKVVPIQLPKPMGDRSHEAFRRQLATIAQKKDRAALGRL